MCGIIGYCGARPALPVLLEGLKRLEYRGYDSAGLAVAERGRIHSVRTVGKVCELEKKAFVQNPPGSFGIAHTRWATHGRPAEKNAHPHLDCSRKIAVVHNGIIENYMDLKQELQAKNHRFLSDTDTEVIVHLIEEYYGGDLEVAILKAVHRLEGTFGIAVMHADADQCIVAVKRGSPVIVGVGEGENVVASDANALLPFTNQLVYLNDDELAVLEPQRYYLKNLQNELLQKKIETVAPVAEADDKRGFPHYMLKEIHEQPQAIENAFRGRLLESEGVAKLGGLEPVLERLKNIRRLIIVSCGTSYYAGLAGRYVFERLTELNVKVELASEFRYQRLLLDESVAVLAISQSGETADTLAGVREAKRKGALILGIVNVVGSSLTQVTDAGVYNHAGPEFGVASTKAYTSQLVILTLMALLIGRSQRLSFNEGLEIIQHLKRLPDQVRQVLESQEAVRRVAEKFAACQNFLFIGRLFNYPTAMEGALKLKEISYIHAEGYPAGEMKHGPISLIDPHFPTVAVVPRDATYDRMLGNIQEIKARDGQIIAVATEASERLSSLCDEVLVVPKTLPILQPILNVVPLQLLAYFIACRRGCDIDKPRNLAKSVTVE